MIEVFYLVVFLLFFAVLAAAYFYLQRAKARDAAKGDAAVVATDAPAPAAATVAASAAPDAPVTTAPGDGSATDQGPDTPTT